MNLATQDLHAYQTTKYSAIFTKAINMQGRFIQPLTNHFLYLIVQSASAKASERAFAYFKRKPNNSETFFK